MWEVDCYFIYSEGSRSRAQRLGKMEGGRNKRYFRVGGGGGVDRIHMIRVGLGLKNPGVNVSGKMHFCYNLSYSVRSRTMAQ